MNVVILAVAICLAGAGAEALFAGSKVRDHLRTLRQPAGSPPFAIWAFIGLAYYAVFFTVLLRALSSNAGVRLFVIADTIAVLLMNAVWNLFFFRAKKFAFAFVLSCVYTLVVLVLLVVLVPVDRVSSFLVATYAAYLVYANIWQYRIWQLNRNYQSGSSESTAG
jgi:tryptophan-rich sensory protein